jgi:hypothetical protein
MGKPSRGVKPSYSSKRLVSCVLLSGSHSRLSLFDSPSPTGTSVLPSHEAVVHQDPWPHSPGLVCALSSLSVPRHREARATWKLRQKSCGVCLFPSTPKLAPWFMVVVHSEAPEAAVRLHSPDASAMHLHRCVPAKEPFWPHCLAQLPFCVPDDRIRRQLQPSISLVVVLQPLMLPEPHGRLLQASLLCNHIPRRHYPHDQGIRR